MWPLTLANAGPDILDNGVKYVSVCIGISEIRLCQGYSYSFVRKKNKTTTKKCIDSCYKSFPVT